MSVQTYHTYGNLGPRKKYHRHNTDKGYMGSYKKTILTFWGLLMFRRNISMLVTQSPNKFGYKTKHISLEPIGIYFTLQFENITYSNEHDYMNICGGEYKTGRWICDTAVNGTRMDFPMPWDITGNLTTVIFQQGTYLQDSPPCLNHSLA